MIEQLRDRLAGRDPSLALAVAGLVQVADRSGTARFDELTVAYRREYLELLRLDRGEATRQRGTLSLDEVREHLRSSVMPRLLAVEIIQYEGDSLVDESVIRVDEGTMALLNESGSEVHDSLTAIALAALREAETPPVRTAADWGSTLSARGLTKAYKRRRVVDNVDIDLSQGEIVGLLGPNGAGKTTTFYMIVGLERPDAGSISIDGTDISRLPMYKRARRGVGYLAQEPSIFRKLTVEDNVKAILETQSLSNEEQDERLQHLLDELSIKYLRDVPAYKLSGGERRRLEITRALVTSPKFMLLDEPFAGVDPIAVNDIQAIVAGLRHRGIGVLITDHNVEQTFDIVDRAYIMFEGKVQVSGTVRELVFDDRVADLYLGPTLTTRLRERLGTAA